MKLIAEGDFNTWICPDGHGFAATLSEAYEVAQEDDLMRLWQLAKKGQPPAAARACPMCTKPMVSVIEPVDEDEIEEGKPGDTPDTDQIPVDVCLADEVIWFDTGEIDRFPDDLPDPVPTPQQEAALARIRDEFGDSIVSASKAREGRADRLADRLLKSQGTFGMVARGLERHDIDSE